VSRSRIGTGAGAPAPRQDTRPCLGHCARRHRGSRFLHTTTSQVLHWSRPAVDQRPALRRSWSFFDGLCCDTLN
jgi:hypothetical protein